MPTLSTTQLDFYLNGLDTSANSIHADLSGNATISFSANASASIDVSLNLLKSIFMFQSDSLDVDNVVATDVQYKVVDPTTSWVYSPADAELYAGSINSGGLDQVQHDWVRYLAQSLFGTHLGVDLFTNEEEVRSNLVTDSLNAIKSRFTALAALGDLTDDDILDGTVQINPSRQILRQIITMDPTRLDEFHNDPVADGNGFFQMPLRAEDKLYFVFTAKSDASQNDIVAGSSVPADRTYLIQMVAKA
jgi:hypothetical protein